MAMAFFLINRIGPKVREIGVEKKVMLCALGMGEDSSKEMLSAF